MSDEKKAGGLTRREFGIAAGAAGIAGVMALATGTEGFAAEKSKEGKVDRGPQKTERAKVVFSVFSFNYCNLGQ